MAVILVGGGARSGKSRYALQLARQRGSRLAFIATATRSDADMSARIDRHRSDRSPEFETIEEPVAIARVIRDAAFDVLVIDCLTLWLANIFKLDIAAETASLIETARASTATVIFVTNELGSGIHPETEIGRKFRDQAGILNQAIAGAADEVYYMIFGQPLRVK